MYLWGQTLTCDMIHLAFSKVIERALKQRDHKGVKLQYDGGCSGHQT